MRRIILAHLLSLLLLHAAAQTKTVHMQGVVNDTSVKSIEITHPVNDKLSKWESMNVAVVNGAFDTSLQVPFPVEISISYGNRAYRKNYIENDTKVLIDTAGALHIIGSPVHDEYEKEFLPFFQSNDRLRDTLNAFYQRNYPKYGGDLPKPIKDSATFLQEKYFHQRARLLVDYIKLHPNSFLPLWDINFFVSMPPTHHYFDFEKLLSSFSNERQQPFLTVLREKLKESAKMQVGQFFPKDFFKGKEQLQGKIQKASRYYLIDFWYSHCNPCIKKFPRLKEIYKQFHGKGFDIVSISVDKQKDKKDYEAAIKKYGLTWNHVWDKDGVNAERFSVNSFPTYVLLDKEGRIIHADIQDDELEAFLKKNLGNL